MESLEGPHPDPFGHALSGAGQKAAELVSVAAMLAQAAAQARARKDGLATAQAEADLAAARAAWAPVLDPGWRADAGLADVARAWGAAVPWEQAEASAAEALGAAEARLRDLHPAAMRGFDRRRAAGATRVGAMLATAGDFVLDPAGSGRPAPGLSEAEAEVLGDVLTTVARLAARSAEAGNGPLDPQAARSVAAGLPAGMAARIAQGLEAGAPPSPAATAPRAAAPVTVSAYGPGAQNWPSGVQAGVQATVLARAAGGRSRQAGRRRAGTANVNARRARPTL